MSPTLVYTNDLIRSAKYLVFIGLMCTAPCFGTSIGVGYLTLLADSPSPGDQLLTINNATGPSNGCSSEYQSCDSLNFTNWTLTVHYSSNYYSGGTNTGSGPVVATPYVLTSATDGDITPTSTNNTLSFDLCGGVNVGNDCTPATTITSVEFAGQISPSNFNAFNGTGTSFFSANPNFDLVWDSTSPTPPSIDDTGNIFAQSQDITVTNQITNSGTPEPASLYLFATLFPLLPFLRRLRRVN